MGMMLGLLSSPTGDLTDDYSAVASRCSLSTNEHGFERATAFVSVPLAEAFKERNGTPHLVYAENGLKAFEGRVEDPGLAAGPDGSGLTLGAYGYWRALSDAPYTALWSESSVSRFRPILNTELAGYKPDLYSMDTQNRLFIGLTKGTIYGTATDYGAFVWDSIAGSSRQITVVAFDYEINLPNGWVFLAFSSNIGYTGTAVIHTVNSAGALITGTAVTTITAKDTLGFEIYNNTGANYNYAGENAASYVRITNLRFTSTSANIVNTTLGTAIAAGVRTVTPASMANIYTGQRLHIDSFGATGESVTVSALTSTTFTATFAKAHLAADTVRACVVYADEIVRDIVATIAALNSTQLSSSTALIQSPGLDLLQEIYEDQYPADIVTRLAALGDTQTPPRQWEVGVWESRMLHFRPRGSVGRAWVVDVGDLTMDRTLDQLHNGAYATYQEPGGRTLRTAASDDATSVARYGLTRRTAVGTQTTSSTQATIQRNTYVQDNKDPIPRVRIGSFVIYDAAGGAWPLWMVRSGDTITIRNLPPSLSISIDRVRTFRVRRTELGLDDTTLTVEPESPLPTLDVLLARQAEGIR